MITINLVAILKIIALMLFWLYFLIGGLWAFDQLRNDIESKNWKYIIGNFFFTLFLWPIIILAGP